MSFEFGNDGPSVILVAVDGSETSMRAGAYAMGTARRQNAKLVCLFVHTVRGLVSTSAEVVNANNTMNRELANELRRQLESRQDDLGIKPVFVERHGNPFTEIVKLADELRADAVIVGASSQAGHRFVGSLAVHLVKASRWPVTVVP